MTQEQQDLEAEVARAKEWVEFYEAQLNVPEAGSAYADRSALKGR
jgi:hypothetical protein